MYNNTRPLTVFEKKWLEYVRKEESISWHDKEIVMPSDKAALTRLVRMGHLKTDEAGWYSLANREQSKHE